jgi:hypothetical protein
MNQRPTVAFLTAAFMGLSLAAAEPPPSAPKKPEAAPEKPTAPVTPVRDGRVDLRPKFEVGQVVRYTMKQVSDQSVPNPEDPKDPMKTRLEQTVGLKMTTKSVDKETGEATVEVMYETVKAKYDSPLGKVDFDSTKPAPKGAKPADADPLEDLVAGQFKGLVGTTMTLKMAKDGRISSVGGGESLIPAGLTGGGGNPDGTNQFEGLFGPITTASTKGFDGTAKVGEKWTHTDGLGIKALGNMDMVTTYDLRSHDRNMAKVFFTGHAGAGSGGTGGGGAAAPVSLESADHKGQYTWDTRLGQLVRFEMEQKTTLSGTLTQGKPMISTSSVTLERVDKK